MDLGKEVELATAMLNTFGVHAFQRASDFAHIESLRGDDTAVARWRRVMVLVNDLSAANHSRGRLGAAAMHHCFTEDA
jgi:hypothetical protein